MSRRVIFHVSFSLATLVAAFILNWLVIGETSPLGNYFLSHDGLPNMWGAVNIIPGLVSAVASGNIHGGSDFALYVAFTIQWLVVGLILSFVALLFRMKREKPTTLHTGAHFQ